MKIENRVRIYMSKWICNGKILDSFSAVVMRNNLDSAVKMYEQMGYKVTK